MPTDDVIKRELSGRGRLDIEIVKVSGNMRYVTIRNDRKGLESVEVWVNRKWFLSGRLKDGQVKSLDISRALVPGKKNRIVLVGRGHVVFFANNPMWRMETQGSFSLLFNAALHFDHLGVGRAAPMGRSGRSARARDCSSSGARAVSPRRIYAG